MGITTDLDEAWWSERCVLTQHARAPALDSSHAFHASTCCQLCFCVHQGEGLKAFRMHTNIVQLLKPHIQAIRRKRKKAGEIQPAEAKKSKPQHPEARRLLDSAMLVLRLHSAAADHMVASENAVEADIPGSGASTSWHMAAQRILVLAGETELLGPMQEAQEFWLHIGYMNHKSKVCSVLPLDKDAASGFHGGMVKLLASDQNVRAYRLFEFLKGHIDFEQIWKMSLYKISSTSEFLTPREFQPSFVRVGCYPEVPEMICWHGWSRKERFHRGGGGGGGSGPGGGRRGGGPAPGPRSAGHPPAPAGAGDEGEDDGGGVGPIPLGDDKAEDENVELPDEAKGHSGSEAASDVEEPPSDGSVADAEAIERAGPDAVPDFLGVDELLSQVPGPVDASAAASSSDARVPQADAVPPAARPAGGRAGGVAGQVKRSCASMSQEVAWCIMRNLKISRPFVWMQAI